MARVLDLDFMIEQDREEQTAGTVKIGGQEYRLMRPDVVEDILVLGAISERAQAFLDVEAPDSKKLRESIDVVKSEMRALVIRLVPDLPDEVLAKTCPTLGMLQKVLGSVLIAARERLPEIVKKKSEELPKSETETETAGSMPYVIGTRAQVDLS